MISEMTEHNYFDGGVPAQTFRKNAITRNENGSFAVKGVKIFRTGQFRDSKGKKHDISDSDLQAMVTNFNQLRSDGMFPDVPVRKDHSESIEKVMGYFSGLTVEGDFLLADFDSLQEEDVNKLAMGLYRNVSAEIGVFPANDDKMYFPTVMGVAYVDIPAVEGLFRADTAQTPEFQFGTNTSTTNSWNSGNLQIDTNAGDWATGWVASHPEITFYSRTKETTVTKENDTYTFRISGQESTDFGAVQAHISQIETENEALKVENSQFAQEKIDADKQARTDYVKQLAADEKIAAAQVEALTESVADMTSDQFASFSKAYDAAPKMRQFSQHGDGSNQGGAEKNERDQQLSVYRERVATLRKSGMAEERITQTDSFKKLTELEASAS